MARGPGWTRCTAARLMCAAALFAALALAAAQTPAPGLVLPGSASGAKLTPEEVDAAIEQVKSSLDDRRLTDAQLEELRDALAQVPRDVLARASPTAGGTTRPPASSDGKLPQEVLDGLLLGLRTTRGGVSTTRANITEAQARLNPSSDCPGFGCVCRSERKDARVAAPGDCTGYVTCNGRGTGTKTLCAVGMGFKADTGACVAMTSSAPGGTRCVFAAAGAQAIVPDLPPPPPAKGTPTAAQRPAGLPEVKTPVLTWSCGQDTDGVNVTLVNMGPSAPNPALGGQALCRLLKTDQQGSLTVRLDDPKLAMSTIAVSYFEAGYGAQLLYTTGYKREVVTSTEATEVPLLDGEGTNQVALWAPRMALFRCPDLPNFLTLRVIQAATGALRISKLVITVTAAPNKDRQMKEAPKDVVAPRSSQLMRPGTFDSSKIVDSADGPGRRLTGDQQLGSAIKWATKLAKNMPKFISKANDIIGKAGDVYSVYKEVMGSLMAGTQCYRQSYSRGAGTFPTTCSSGWEFSAGLCYEACRAGWTNVNFLCWENCKSGWTDHLATCHIPMQTVANSNNGCAWFDICATWYNTGCRRCSSGFRRDGCLCTRDPQFQAKATSIRASRSPGCPAGRLWENGLCYGPCNTGYWGESFLCYNYCPDAFPTSCGIGLCAKTQKVCAEFVTEAVLTSAAFIASLASTIATGGGGVVDTLSSAVDVVMFFKDTDVCEKQGIHLPSNMAVTEVKDREFQGTDLFALVGTNWDACLIACKNTPKCDFVILAANGKDCVGRSNIGDGPAGKNAYAAGVRTGVAIMRTPVERINWMWADGPESALGGELLKMEDGRTVVVHGASDGPNLMVCMVACLSEKKCTHFVYNDQRCWMMNAFGANKRTWAAGGTYSEPGLSAVPNPTSTMVNVVKIPSVDRPS